MIRQRAFTLNELVCTCVLLLFVLASMQMTIGCGLGTARRNARVMQSATQVRGIIQGMINHSPSNNEWYPGRARDGTEDTTLIAAVPNRQYGCNVTGDDPAFRYAFLLRNNYFSPDYAVSPSETDSKITTASLDSGGNITAATFSFPMLEPAPGKTRNGEWKAVNNSMAVIVTDRNLAASAAKPGSIHDAGTWRGTVGYNDNHVVFETTHLIAGTQYTLSSPAVVQDNLFQSGDALESPAPAFISEPDALMTYKSPNDGGVNQNP